MDLSGKTFDRWTVLHKDTENKRKYICRCSCGTLKSVWESNLIGGKSKSCGCLISDAAKERNYTHGKSKTRAYTLWSNMRRRCNDPCNKRYARYGGRGIRVCKEWDNDFSFFYRWLLSEGYNENSPYGAQTVDRIDNDGNYEPGNCRLTSIKEQCRNRSTNHILEYNGIKMSITEWNDYLGFPNGALDNRLRKGWEIERAITTPLKKRKKNDKSTENSIYKRNSTVCAGSI